MNNAKSIEIAEKLKLHPGDHLIAQRILYTHHGLYIDEGYVAEYSLEGVDQPIGVSEYRLKDSLPEEYVEFLPSPEDLEARL